VIFNESDRLAGRPVRFTESDAPLRAALLAEAGTRSARLLADPERNSRSDRPAGPRAPR
jgi:hypothetical protein